MRSLPRLPSILPCEEFRYPESCAAGVHPYPTHGSGQAWRPIIAGSAPDGLQAATGGDHVPLGPASGITEATRDATGPPPWLCAWVWPGPPLQVRGSGQGGGPDLGPRPACQGYVTNVPEARSLGYRAREAELPLAIVSWPDGKQVQVQGEAPPDTGGGASDPATSLEGTSAILERRVGS